MMKRIVVSKVSKKFKIGFKKNQGVLSRLVSLISEREPKKIIWVLKNISFNAKAGEILGIVGKNGSGKSTLLRTLAGIYKQDKGEIKNSGRIIPIINLNHSLHARLTMRDNIFLVASLFGLSDAEIKKKLNPIIEFSELGSFINTKIYQFSEGMKARLVFSIAIHSDPEILLLDEIFEVGDENFRLKSAEKIKSLVKNNASVILVSHNLDLIERYCDRVIWMEKGEIKKIRRAREMVGEYKKSV